MSLEVTGLVVEPGAICLSNTDLSFETAEPLHKRTDHRLRE